MKRSTIHIVGGESRARAQLARVVYDLGLHAEVYSDLLELVDRAPVDGIVFASEPDDLGGVATLIERLYERGIPLPVVIVSAEPEVERAVSAMKAGALDYLSLPLETYGLARRLSGMLVEADRYAQQRQIELDAKSAVTSLSRRELQVLELLSAGYSNKDIAVQLKISPRTVEIHRGKMMLKLGAGNAADAVRVWFEAGLENPARDHDLSRAQFLRAKEPDADVQPVLPGDRADWQVPKPTH